MDPNYTKDSCKVRWKKQNTAENTHEQKLNFSYFRKGVILRDVSIAYENNEVESKDLIRNINLNCKPFEHIGIIGRTGAGTV